MQDERGEQLKNMTNLSALLAGFAMASFLQFGFDDSTVNIGVLIAFGLTTAVVVRPCPLESVKRCRKI